MFNIADYLKNANQNYNEVLPHTGQNGHHQKIYKQSMLERGETFYTVGGNINWHNHYRQQYGSSFKKLKLELPYDTEILDIYPEKTTI